MAIFVPIRLLCARSSQVLAVIGTFVLSIGDTRADTARAFEVKRVIEDIHRVLQPVHEHGAQVEFVLWSSRGAVTMVSHRRVRLGGTRHGGLSLDDMRKAIDPATLRMYVGTTDRYLTLVIQRERRAWRWLSTSGESPNQHPPYPAEGRSIPVVATGITQDTHRGLFQAVKRLRRFLSIPQRVRATIRFEVVFEDQRVLSGALATYRVDSSKRTLGDAVVDEFAVRRRVYSALLPFARGMGRRTIFVDIHGEHREGERESRWVIAHARVERVSERTDIAQQIVRDYRHEHEQIIVRWRQGVRDSVMMMAGFTMEQVALWVVGGWLFKAAGAAIRPLAPRLMGALRGFGSKGNRSATEYLETQLSRLSAQDKDALRALMAKSEIKGFNALKANERTQLELLVKRLESNLVRPLSEAEKVDLRRSSRGRFALGHPAIVETFKHARVEKQIHHRIPLEWAHRLPTSDVNSLNNLVALHPVVHRAVGAVWTRFRTAPSARVTESHVSSVAHIVDRHFQHWYNTVPGPKGLKQAARRAKNHARAEVDTIVAMLRRAGR